MVNFLIMGEFWLSNWNLKIYNWHLQLAKFAQWIVTPIIGPMLWLIELIVTKGTYGVFTGMATKIDYWTVNIIGNLPIIKMSMES